MNTLLRYITFIAASAASSIAIAGTVSSLSRVASLSDSNGNSYQQIAVNCSHVSELRNLIKAEGSTQWCSESAPQLCAKSKISAAKNVCGSKFDRALRQQANQTKPATLQTPIEPVKGVVVKPSPAVEAVEQPASAPAPKPAMRADAELLREQRRIDLEQQRLELRRQELELKRQQLELEQRSSENR